LVVSTLVFTLPVTARAVTADDLVALTRAGLSDEVLLALIDADQTIFDLRADQVLALKQAGLSDAVLRKMLGSRQEFSPVLEVPPVLITGIRPEPAGVVQAPFTVFPYSPFAFAVPYRTPRPHDFTAAAPESVSPLHRGFGRFMNDGTRRFLNDGWVGPPFQRTTPAPPAPRPKAAR
jgi:hypothetical protein